MELKLFIKELKLIWTEETSFNDRTIIDEIKSQGKVPNHIAVIMDGNGRWAIEQGLKRTKGHLEGIESVRDIVKASVQLGLKHITLYAFSIENWKRPASEVTILMKLLETYLKKEFKEINENNIKLNAIGRLNSLPKSVNNVLHKIMEQTKNNTGLTLTLALSYSGRWDIVRAVQMLSLDVRRGKLSPEDISDELFSKYLQTNNLPDPDLLIRTSGEMRLSNFMLWEMAYSEIYISEKYWPSFRRNDFFEAILNFQRRERRFGMISAQVTDNKTNNNSSYFQRVVNAINL